MRQIVLRMEDEVVDEVDRVRGDIPRERWLRRLVEAELKRLRAKEHVPPHLAASAR